MTEDSAHWCMQRNINKVQNLWFIHICIKVHKVSPWSKKLMYTHKHTLKMFFKVCWLGPKFNIFWNISKCIDLVPNFIHFEIFFSKCIIFSKYIAIMHILSHLIFSNLLHYYFHFLIFRLLFVQGSEILPRTVMGRWMWQEMSVWPGLRRTVHLQRQVTPIF